MQRDTCRTTLAVFHDSWIYSRVRAFCRRPTRPESPPTPGCATSTNTWIAELGVEGLITGHVGPKAFSTLQAGEVKI
jgi:hypothetical protein